MTNGVIMILVLAVFLILGIGAGLAMWIRAKVRTRIVRIELSLHTESRRVEASLRTEVQRVETSLRTEVERAEALLRTEVERAEASSLRTEVERVGTSLRKAIARNYVEDRLPPRPKHSRRSVLFLHQSYYHFLHLAAALRRRGWDAALVSIDPPDNPDHRFFHGEDVNLFSHDSEEFRSRLHALHGVILDRFRMVHFAGVGSMSLFPENHVLTESDCKAPWDFLEMKDQGVKVGYTISGCNDGIRQSVYKKHKNVCATCVWEFRPEVCSDARNAAWGNKLAAVCDLVAVEAEYGHEWRNLPFVHREPLTVALDPDYWKPELEVPEAWHLPRADGEMIVLHGFGNAESRRVEGRDIKGTHAVLAAVERLRSEGFNVRLEHSINVHSHDMRFLQVQADVIVDQLNIGRYGAQAREGMMLGRPTVCHIDRREPAGVPELSCWDECPLVDATEETIYPVLKRLLSSPEERARIGRASRAYAIKWHAADNAAKRFERIYDRMMSGLPLNVSGAELHGAQ